MTIRNGDREVIKVRQFVRIATNLSLIDRHLRHRHPALQPACASSPRRTATASYPSRSPEVADADVSVVKSDLTLLSVEANAPALSDDDVVAHHRGGAAPRGAGRTARRRADPGAADAVAHAAPARPLRRRAGLCPHRRFALQLDRGAGRPRERHELRQGRAARRRAARRGSRHHPQEGRDPRIGPARLSAPVPTRSAASSRRSRARIKVAAVPEGQRMRILVAPGPRPGDGKQVVRVVLFGERGIEAHRAVERSRRLRLGDAAERELPRRRSPAARRRTRRRRRTTAPASGSTRASTRRR